MTRLKRHHQTWIITSYTVCDKNVTFRSLYTQKLTHTHAQIHTLKFNIKIKLAFQVSSMDTSSVVECCNAGSLLGET